jgi:hypothetical protein
MAISVYEISPCTKFENISDESRTKNLWRVNNPADFGLFTRRLAGRKYKRRGMDSSNTEMVFTESLLSDLNRVNKCE